MDITRDTATGEVCYCAALPFISWNLNPTSPSYSFSVPEYNNKKRKEKKPHPTTKVAVPAMIWNWRA